MPYSESASVPDDAAIDGSTRVFRRINSGWYLLSDEGRGRITSQAFQDKGGSLSVGLEVVLIEMELGFEAVLAGFPGYGLAALSVEFLRSLKLGVVRDPTETEPWHGCVYGNKSASIRSTMARTAVVLREPDISISAD